ncbi:MAG TPA: iron ABC transporter permease [Ensifer sp.]|nr:iron ABC transporter permease [Ensifer sp.]
MTSAVASTTRAASSAQSYRQSVGFRSAVVVVVIMAAIAAMICDLAVGSGTLTFREVLDAIFAPGTADPTSVVVVWQMRAPMTVIAAIAGISLALAGSLMQTVLNNPLAEPFTLGISSAAGFGAAIAIVFQTSVLGAASWLPPELFVAANAFFFSLLTVALVTILAGQAGLGVETVTLIGIAIHFVFSALLAFAQYVADPNQLQSLVFWLLGSLLRATWTKVEINGVILAVVLPLLLLQAWSLTALRAFGEQAVVLGVRVERLRLASMVAAALLAGAATATIGIIGFIGLVAPHIARLLVGEDQRFCLPLTAASGALILTLASLASKLILPGAVLPIGMVTSLLGVPFFLGQILYRKRRVRR